MQTRKQFAQTREQLISIQRTAGTEAHDLIATLSKVRKDECLIMISDMPVTSWEGLIPKSALPPVIINISDYDGSSRLRKGGAR